LDFFANLFRNLIGCIERSGGRDGGNAGQLGDISQSDGATAPSAPFCDFFVSHKLLCYDYGTAIITLKSI
jgi:hypothetical protein